MSNYSRLGGGQSGMQVTAEQIREFKKKVTKLKEYNSYIGTQRDTKALRAQITQEVEDSNRLSKEIMQHFKTFKPSRQEKVMNDKLAKEFESIFQQFNQVNSSIIEKEKQITHLIADTLHDEHYQRTGELPQGSESQRRQSLLLQEIGDFDEVVLRERDENIKQLEKDFQEVNRLFTDVAQLVQEQGEVLNEAEEHVDVAYDETTKGVKDLESAETYQRRSAKKLICLIVLVVILVTAVVVPAVLFS